MNLIHIRKNNKWLHLKTIPAPCFDLDIPKYNACAMELSNSLERLLLVDIINANIHERIEGIEYYTYHFGILACILHLFPT